jgi:hypothetical protein
MISTCIRWTRTTDKDVGKIEKIILKNGCRKYDIATPSGSL